MTAFAKLPQAAADTPYEEYRALTASHLDNAIIAVALSLLLGVGLGLWLRRPLQRYLDGRRQARELEQLFAATNRQQQLERVNERRELYLAFRNATTALVEELADGGGRWATFYLARDLLAAINAKAGPEVALAARQVCFLCQVMLNEGFSDSLSVKFMQSLGRFEDGVRADLAAEADGRAWPPAPVTPTGPGRLPVADPDAAGNSGSRRQYFNVLR